MENFIFCAVYMVDTAITDHEPVSSFYIKKSCFAAVKNYIWEKHP